VDIQQLLPQLIQPKPGVDVNPRYAESALTTHTEFGSHGLRMNRCLRVNPIKVCEQVYFLVCVCVW
jgi:hypothetical protein